LIKAKATGVQIARSMACHASATRKGMIVSFACLAKAQTKLGRKFAKADKKGCCGMPDDATIVGESVRALAEGIAAGLFPVDATDTARRCAFSKMRRTGAYGKGQLACWAHAVRDDVEVDPECQQAVAAGLEDAFVKREAKGGCATTGDQPDVQQAVDGFADAVVGLLMPSSTTTSTAFSGSTTTSTMLLGSTSTTMVGATTSTTVVSASTTTSTVPSVVSLSLHVQPVLTAHCATAGCHAGVHPAEGMDLTAGYAHGNLVNVASAECPLFKRVLPGKPGQSYLVFKLAGPPQPCFSGNQMPGGGAAPLSAADQNLIVTWITQGAANN